MATCPIWRRDAGALAPLRGAAHAAHNRWLRVHYLYGACANDRRMLIRAPLNGGHGVIAIRADEVEHRNFVKGATLTVHIWM